VLPWGSEKRGWESSAVDKSCKMNVRVCTQGKGQGMEACIIFERSLHQLHGPIIQQILLFYE
jgi:hypothetical protein